MVCNQGKGGLNFLVGVIYNRSGKLKLFVLQGEPQISSLGGTCDLPIRKTLRRVLDLITVLVFKRVSESIFFQIDRFTVCKFKDKREVANSFMSFNLLKIIYPFQGKRHLRPSQS